MNTYYIVTLRRLRDSKEFVVTGKDKFDAAQRARCQEGWAQAVVLAVSEYVLTHSNSLTSDC